MVGAMASHELVLADAVKDCVHHRPLIGRLPPPALCFFRRKTDRCASPHIYLEYSVFYEDSARDDLTWLADAFERAAAEREITSPAGAG